MVVSFLGAARHHIHAHAVVAAAKIGGSRLAPRRKTFQSLFVDTTRNRTREFFDTRRSPTTHIL